MNRVGVKPSSLFLLCFSDLTHHSKYRSHTVVSCFYIFRCVAICFQ